MNKKIIAFLLAVLMLVPAIVSCGGKKEEETKKPSNQTNAPESGEFAEIDAYVDDLAAEHSFDGVDFTIVGSTGMVVYPEEKEETGVLENDALYNRIRVIEEKFGVETKFDESTGDGYDNTGAETCDKVARDVMAGTMTYDLIEGDLTTVGQNLLGNGRISSIDTDSFIDFSRSWWIEDIEDQLGIGGKLYFMTGKINPSHYDGASAILFNKEVAENFGIDKAELYQLVEDGKWTFDAMNTIAEKVNSSEVKRYIMGASNGDSMYLGAGFTVSTRNENGDPVIPASLSAEAVDYIDKMAVVFGDTATVYNTKNNSGEPDESIGQFYDRQVFEDGKVLFWIDGVGRAIDLREQGFEAEFGILPIPKKDENQKDYLSAAGGRAMYFSMSLKDEEMSYVIVEAMAALSEKYLEPAFYEKALQGRSTSDLESRDVLDKLYNSKVLDLAGVYEWGNVSALIGEAVVGDKDAYTGSYSSSARVAKNEINKLLRNIAKDDK